MSTLNQRRRRNRTIRLEILDSRALLSTAGVVSRPAAAVAPLARFAHFSSIAGDPKVKSESPAKGDYVINKASVPAVLTFNTHGFIIGDTNPFHINYIRFDGSMKAKLLENGKGTEFTNGQAVATGLRDSKLVIHFHGSEKHNDITLEGTVTSGSSDFGAHVTGSFKATGKFPAMKKIELSYTITWM
jgi:hypothetical protein